MSRKICEAKIKNEKGCSSFNYLQKVIAKKTSLMNFNNPHCFDFGRLYIAINFIKANLFFRVVSGLGLFSLYIYFMKEDQCQSV